MDGSPKTLPVDGGISEQLAFNLGKQGSQPIRIHDSLPDERLHIDGVAVVTPLEFRQHLGVGIEVIDGELAELPDERVPVAPAGKGGDEVRGRDDLHVEVQALLEGQHRAKHVIALRIQSEVHIDGGVPKSAQELRRAAGQIQAGGLPGGSREFLQKPLKAGAIYGLTHARALS